MVFSTGVLAAMKICSPYIAAMSILGPSPTTMGGKKRDSSGRIVRGGKSAIAFLSVNRGVEEGQS